MSVRMITRAFDYSMEYGLKPTRRLLLFTMADAADDDGRLWPSQRRLHLLTGLGESTIREALREFEKLGVLDTQTRVRDEGRGRTSNLYRLNLQPPGLGARSDEQPPAAEGAPRQHSADQPPDTGGPIDRRTVREPSIGTVSAAQAPAPRLPDAVEAPLRAVATAKGAALDVAAVGRACTAYPDRDIPTEAEGFCAWHLHGAGQNAPLSSIARGFRNWLSRAKPSRTRRSSAPPPSLPGVVQETARAREAWTAARALLAEELPGSTYRMWIEPLEAAGEADGQLVLRDGTSHLAGWADRRYATMIGEALAKVSDFSAVRVVDDLQLTGQVEAA